MIIWMLLDSERRWYVRNLYFLFQISFNIATSVTQTRFFFLGRRVGEKKCFDAPCWLLLTWIRYVISLFKTCFDESESRGYEYECMYSRTMRACVLTSSGFLMFSASERRRWYSSHLSVNPDYLLFGLLAVNLLQDTNYLIAGFISKNIIIIHSDNLCNLCSITLMFNTTPPF